MLLSFSFPFFLFLFSMLFFTTFCIENSFHQKNLQISNYSGAGVSPDLQDKMIIAIVNAYNKYNSNYRVDQAKSISAELEQNSNYKFTVLLIDENPVDTWFTLRALDEIYVVWQGVNKMIITWTYCIFANGIKGDDKNEKQVYFYDIGDGISLNQQKIIQNAITTQQLVSCLYAGKYIGISLQQLDSQSWTSLCKPFSNGSIYALVVSKNDQYYLGHGKKCLCLIYV